MIKSTNIRPRRLAGLLAVMVLAPLAACGGIDSGTSEESAAATVVDAAADTFDTAYDDAAYDESASDESAVDRNLPSAVAPGVDGGTAEFIPADEQVTVPGSIDPSRAVIITADVQMHADDVATAAASIIELVSASGGHIEARYIVNDDPEGGTRGSASITARVPPAGAEGFIAQLESIAPVDAVSQDATDVTDQLTDLDIRIENARASLDRIRALMDQATRIDDLANLEYELSNRQVNLEQLEAQKASIGNSVALATIGIRIRSTADLETGPPAPSDVSILGAAKTGWRGFVEVVYSVLLVIATLWPVIVLAFIGVMVFRWQRRRRRNRRSEAGLVMCDDVADSGTDAEADTDSEAEVAGA